jgi:opacity protein-like surface antigen
MMKKLSLLLGLLLAVVCPVRAERPSLNRLDIGAGASIPSGDYTNDFMEVGYSLGAQYLHFFSPRFAVGPQFDYLKPGKKTRDYTGGSVDYEFHSNLILAAARLYLTDSGIQPYVQGLLGYHDTSVDVTANVNFFGLALSATQSQSSSGLAVGGGAGIEIPASQMVSMDIGGDWVRLKTDRDKFGHDLEMISVMARVNFYIGK